MWKNWKPIKFPWTKELERGLNLREKNLCSSSRVVSWAKVTSVCEVWVQFAVCWSDTKAVSYLFPKTPRKVCWTRAAQCVSHGQNPPTVLGLSHKEQVHEGKWDLVPWLHDFRGVCVMALVRAGAWLTVGTQIKGYFWLCLESLSGWD